MHPICIWSGHSAVVVAPGYAVLPYGGGRADLWDNAEQILGALQASLRWARLLLPAMHLLVSVHRLSTEADSSMLNVTSSKDLHQLILFAL